MGPKIVKLQGIAWDRDSSNIVQIRGYKIAKLQEIARKFRMWQLSVSKIVQNFAYCAL